MMNVLLKKQDMPDLNPPRRTGISEKEKYPKVRLTF